LSPGRLAENARPAVKRQPYATGMKLLFIGDIVGKPGREIVTAQVARLKTERGIDFIIADGENAAAGSGITAAIAQTLRDAGVDAITLGDHVWDQKGFETDIKGLSYVCRPANLPVANPGRDHLIVEKNGFRLLVFTVLGRTFMGLKADCPFLCADAMLQRLSGQFDGALVEIHAEATSEKQALGWHLAGRATAVLGTQGLDAADNLRYHAADDCFFIDEALDFSH